VAETALVMLSLGGSTWRLEFDNSPPPSPLRLSIDPTKTVLMCAKESINFLAAGATPLKLIT
jgi:hypothetical protein